MARSEGTNQARATTTVSAAAAPANRALRLRAATTPLMACERGTRPTEAKMMRLIMRPMSCCGVRACTQAKNITVR